jgi:hypothetical protein
MSIDQSKLEAATESAAQSSVYGLGSGDVRIVVLTFLDAFVGANRHLDDAERTVLASLRHGLDDISAYIKERPQAATDRQLADNVRKTADRLRGVMGILDDIAEGEFDDSARKPPE